MLAVGIVLVTGVLILCGVSVVAYFLFHGQPSGPEATAVTPSVDPRDATLTIAYSPEKAALMKELTKRFNDQRQRTPDGRRMEVRLLELDPEEMVKQALSAPAFQALTPDSSLWLDQLDRAWAEQQGATEAGTIAPTLTSERVRYAVSPVVVAMWKSVAKEMGWPDKPIGWVDIQRRAQEDPDFKWNHASTAHASGLLATLAEFYAGAGVTRGLTEEAATAQSTLDYVAAIEKTVRYYGEGELAVLAQVQKEGRRYLDAFVVQEALLVEFNRQGGGPDGRLVAIYPKEGTLWADHPLALLESAMLTDNRRRTFHAFSEFLLAPESQQLVLRFGYRPADLTIPLDSPGSPLTPENGVDPSQPQTTLQMPGPNVVEVVRNVWYYTKRKTNVYLVVDTSGSMRGDKLQAAQEALRIFLDQILSDLERVGMVEFSTEVYNILFLDELKHNRTELQQEFNKLKAGGDTALLDAIHAAYVRLQEMDDRERINAIVVMTDGRENASNIRLRELVREIQQGTREGVPVVIFCIAYGRDADYDTLRAIAEASGGQVRTGDPETIRELYKILSSYF